MAGHFQADIAFLEELAGYGSGCLAEQAHQRKFAQQYDRFLVVAPSDCGVFDLAKVRESCVM